MWMSSLNAMTLARSLAESDNDWPLLFRCRLGRLQVMHERLSGIVENPYAVWTSGDAALTKMDGVNWKCKEFFQLEPIGLMADFHAGQLRAYTIGEIELMTAVGITVFWGDIWTGKQIILLGADNQNTFSRIDSRTAKLGLALGIIATFHVRRIKNGIESYPYYLRSLRDIRPDFVTRENRHNVDMWAHETGFIEVAKPWRWKQFTSCAPKLDWLEDRVVNLPRHLKIGNTSCLGLYGEWPPLSGIGLQIFDDLGLDYRAINGMSLFGLYKHDTDATWKLIFGSARHKGEIDSFRYFLNAACFDIAIMLTPSEVEEEIWYKGGFWTQGWHCDSAKYGDMLAGSWNIYVKSNETYSSLELTVPGRMMSSIRCAFGDKGLYFLDNPIGVKFIRPVGNSIGRTIVARRGNGGGKTQSGCTNSTL